jgi:diguanylate cyclase (GGDEF)-like protein
MTADSRGRLTLPAVACLGFALVAICASVLPSADTGARISAFTSAVACVATLVCLVWTGRRARGADRRWRLILAAATAPTAFVAGWHAHWVYVHGAVQVSAEPVWADAFLLIVLINLAGVLAFPTDPLKPATTEVGHDGLHWYAITALDSLVIVGSLYLMIWATLLAPVLEVQHLNTVGLISVVGATSGYLVLVASVLMLATFRQPRSWLALALLGTGLTVLAVSTMLYLVLIAEAVHRVPAAVDAISTVGWLVILLAALVPIPDAVAVRRGGPRTVWVRSALPYLALGAAGLLVVGQLIANSPIGRVERTVLVALLLVVLARQMMTLSDNTRLLAAVEASRQELHHQALHDPLTGLANRALFTDRLEHALAFRDSRRFALVFCDLDDFKGVNDTLGHAAGDALLNLTAQRLRAGVRPADTVARLGGDEFALLIEDEGGDSLENACHRLAAMMREPVPLAGHAHPVGASLGIVLADPAHPMDPDTLLRKADLAMYAAKRQGKGGMVVHRPDPRAPEPAPQLRADLARALRGNRDAGFITTAYRPVVDLRTGRMTAVDAVATWLHPQCGRVATEQVDRLADEAGLAGGIVERVLRDVGHDVRAQGRSPLPVPVFVRVPLGREVTATSVDDLARVLGEHHLSPDWIILSLAVGSGPPPDLAALSGGLRRLADQGYRLALGDVDGQRATLAAWCNTLPIEIIRLDPHLTNVDATPDPKRTRRGRGAVLAAAFRLELTVVATGVTSAAQARDLAVAGCHLGAGPLYDPPLPLGEGCRARLASGRDSERPEATARARHPKHSTRGPGPEAAARGPPAGPPPSLAATSVNTTPRAARVTGARTPGRGHWPDHLWRRAAGTLGDVLGPTRRTRHAARQISARGPSRRGGCRWRGTGRPGNVRSAVPERPRRGRFGSMSGDTEKRTGRGLGQAPPR